MTRPLIVALPGCERLAAAISAEAGAELAEIETRRFPDDEVYLRLKFDPRGRSVAFIGRLDHPDSKLLAALFASGVARELGAVQVGLVAPYLPYMRQDKRFKEGEAVTSIHFARLLSSAFDWLVTIDPHLHRFHSLGDVYSIPAIALQAAPCLSDWIRSHAERPVLIGPDSESEQWVSAVAARAGAPHVILSKERFGDRDVRITIPDLTPFGERIPVLVDDIVSSARTMIEAARQLNRAGLPPPICVAVHALFSRDSCQSLAKVAARIATTNTVSHETNAIDIAPLVAAGLEEVL